MVEKEILGSVKELGVLLFILRKSQQKKGFRNEQNYKNSIHVGSNRNNL